MYLKPDGPVAGEYKSNEMVVSIYSRCTHTHLVQSIVESVGAVERAYVCVHVLFVNIFMPVRRFHGEAIRIKWSEWTVKTYLRSLQYYEHTNTHTPTFSPIRWMDTSTQQLSGSSLCMCASVFVCSRPIVHPYIRTAVAEWVYTPVEKEYNIKTSSLLRPTSDSSFLI